jgi:hypothetical protein
MRIKKLDWAKWFYSLGREVIQGAAGAVSTVLGAALTAPEKFNTGQPGSVLKLAGAVFLINAVWKLFIFLKKQPLPKLIEEDLSNERA